MRRAAIFDVVECTSMKVVDLDCTVDEDWPEIVNGSRHGYKGFNTLSLCLSPFHFPTTFVVS